MRCTLIWSDIGNYHAARTLSTTSLRNIAVRVIEIRGQASFAEFRATDSAIGQLNPTSLRLSPPHDARRIRVALTRELEKQSPDVVFIPGWSAVEALVALQWTAKSGVASVIMSESTRHDDRRRLFKESVKRLIVSLADAAFVGGRAHAEYMNSLGMPDHRITYGYDVVDNLHFGRGAAIARVNAAKVRAELGLPERYFLCCARLIPKKNIGSLIEAYHSYRANSDHEPWDLVIVGPGPMKDGLKEAADALGVGSTCHLVGPKSYSDLPAYYGLAQAFVIPSKVEPWGLVVNEAMASGLPIIASWMSGSVSELVQDGHNGFVVDPFDVASITDGLLRISRNDCDRKGMGAASEKIVQGWGLDRFAAGFESAAKLAVASPKRARPSVLNRLLLDVLINR